MRRALLAPLLAAALTEIVSERTASTTTWANADGTTTVEAYTGPIRVEQPDGSMVAAAAASGRPTAPSPAQ
ncbi:hypothetical protein [Streptomyces herbicida]|uniref:hypothetical protein n=1 Tax=Streptomyces herbicida TaxID=3065675 RepID=UPI00292CD6C7|nr:hypothetical protein [Streptomyces sp. NEAU-HV9]